MGERKHGGNGRDLIHDGCSRWGRKSTRLLLGPLWSSPSSQFDLTSHVFITINKCVRTLLLQFTMGSHNFMKDIFWVSLYSTQTSLEVGTLRAAFCNACTRPPMNKRHLKQDSKGFWRSSANTDCISSNKNTSKLCSTRITAHSLAHCRQ